MERMSTIGFSKKSLRAFSELLINSGVTCLIDTRLNNTSQLSGFAKKDDLKYILEEFLNIEYIHRVDLAPTQDILSDFKSKLITWDEYTQRYLSLLKTRKIEKNLDDIFNNHQNVCFLCSEHKPHHCHRSLLVNYIKEYKKNVEIIHLY
ncbi:DUF488 domain-containing protein [Peribacillus frigoritolerans]|uniref:DUF488 domain-containing protein n=1 Tax=Peribacillus frigoritolerans TaxID=450367 RepID=UPI002ED3C1F8|nr:DUF488 domain-containing protein [Peribacillus frigoritolerans]